MTQDSHVRTWEEGWMGLSPVALHADRWEAKDLVVPDSVMLGLMLAL